MADETENLTLRLLREIRAEQDATNLRIDATNAKLDAFTVEQRGANTKLEAKLDSSVSNLLA